MNNIQKLELYCERADTVVKDITNNYLKDITQIGKESLLLSVLFSDHHTNKIINYLSLDSILFIKNISNQQPFLDVSNETLIQSVQYLFEILNTYANNATKNLALVLTFCNSNIDVFTMLSKANKIKRLPYDFSWVNDSCEYTYIFKELKEHDNSKDNSKFLQDNLSRFDFDKDKEIILRYIFTRILRFYNYLYKFKNNYIGFEYEDFKLDKFKLPQKSYYSLQMGNKNVQELICSIISLTFNTKLSFYEYMVKLTEKIQCLQ